MNVWEGLDLPKHGFGVAQLCGRYRSNLMKMESMRSPSNLATTIEMSFCLRPKKRHVSHLLTLSRPQDAAIKCDHAFKARCGAAWDGQMLQHLAQLAAGDTALQRAAPKRACLCSCQEEQMVNRSENDSGEKERHSTWMSTCRSFRARAGISNLVLLIPAHSKDNLTTCRAKTPACYHKRGRCLL